MIKPAPEPGDKDRDLRIDGNALIGAIARSLADGAAATSIRSLGNELAAVRLRITSLDAELKEARIALQAERAQTAGLEGLLASAEQVRAELQQRDADRVARIDELAARNTDGVFRISELEQLVAAAEIARDELQSRDADRVSRIGQLEQQLAAADQIAAELQSRDTDRIFRIGELEQLLAAAERAREELQAGNTDGVFRIGELEQLLAAAETAGIELQSRDTDRVARIGELEQLLANAERTAADLQSRDTGRVARIGELERLLATTERAREELLVRNAEDVVRVGDLEQRLAAAETAAAELQSHDTGRVARIGELEQLLGAAAARLARSERALAVERQMREDLESQFGAHAKRIRDLEGEVALHVFELQKERSAREKVARLAQLSDLRIDELEQTAELAIAGLAAAQDEIKTLEDSWSKLYTELERAREQLKRRDAAAVAQAGNLAQSELRLRAAERELSELRSALAARTEDQDAIEDFRALLDSATKESEDARKDAETLRASFAHARDEVVRARQHADSLAAQLSAALVQSAQFESRIALARELEIELEAVRSASLADKALMNEYATQVREQSDRLAGELRAELFEAGERERQAREHFSEQLQNIERGVNEENRQLRERVADAEHALAAQTDATIAAMQAENAQLSKLVDTVQSSRFWQFKRWLNRLREAFRS